MLSSINSSRNAFLFTRLSPIMLHAQELAVLGHGLSAFDPGGDVVGFHFVDFPMRLLPVLGNAVGADASLALVNLALHRLVKRPKIQELLIPRQHVLVNPRFLLDLRVLHQRGNLRFQGGRVQHLRPELIVQFAPGKTLHFFPIGGEDGLDPVDDVAVVEPEFVAVGVMLVVGHVLLDVPTGDPLQPQFQQSLPIDFAADVLVAQADAGAAGLGEVPLGIREPGAGVDGVSEFLVRQFQSGDVHDPEPVQLLGVRAFAEIDHKLVVQDLRLLVVGEGVEVFFVDGKVVVQELADGKGALLAVQDFEGAIFFLHPVHDVQGETVADGVDDFVALLAGVDKLTLVLGADVQAAAIGDHALLLRVLVTVEEGADGDFVKGDGHFFLRIAILV